MTNRMDLRENAYALILDFFIKKGVDKWIQPPLTGGMRATSSVGFNTRLSSA